MKVSCGYIEEYLAERFAVVSFIEDYRSEYGLPVVYRGEGSVEPGRVYVVERSFSNDLADAQNVLVVVCCGDDGPPDSNLGNALTAFGDSAGKLRFGTQRAKEVFPQRILVQTPSSDLRAVAEALYDLFYREGEWVDTLTRLCMGDARRGVKDFLDASVGRFADALLYYPVAKWRSCVHASTGDWRSTPLRGLLDGDGVHYSGSVDVSGLESAISSEEPQRSSVVDGRGEVIEVLAVAVRGMGKSYSGLLVAPVTGDFSSQAHLWRIEKLRQALEAYLRTALFCNAVDSGSPRAVLKRLVLGDAVNLRDAKKLLNQLGFSTSDAVYVCLALRMTDIDAAAIAPQRICAVIESMSNGVLAAEVQGDLHVLIDTRSCDIPYRELVETMEDYFALNKVQIGVSFEFSDLMMVKDCAVQALAALRIGSELDPSLGIHQFADVVVPYVLKHGTADLSARQLSAPGLLALEKGSEGVDLMGTLRAYVRNLYNVTSTAKELYVHRSTLLHRLDQISRLIQMDLSDPENRFYIELSLHMLDQG